MTCPRCESPLEERDRDGVTIDVCRQCRGLWLDRGELEKLIARTTAEFEDYGRTVRAEAPRHPEPPRHHDDRHRDDRYRDRDDYYRKHHRKKGFLETIGDIFD